MKRHSDDAIREFMAGLFRVNARDVEVYQRDGFTSVRVCDRNSLRFSDLMAMTEFFDTKEINESGHFVSAGCETCGDGSRSDLDFTIQEAK